MRPWNRNYVGTHFGGSLFAMTDPFWMLLTMHALGRDYIVWDQAGEIEFVKPGPRHGACRIPSRRATLDAAARGHRRAASKYLRWFDTDVIDDEGEVVARVRKQLYVRRKRDRASDRSAAS